MATRVADDDDSQVCVWLLVAEENIDNNQLVKESGQL